MIATWIIFLVPRGKTPGPDVYANLTVCEKGTDAFGRNDIFKCQFQNSFA